MYSCFGCVIPCIRIPHISALLHPMVPNRTSEPQCLQELGSFRNTVTGPCVLDCSSGGFRRGFFFKEYEGEKRDTSPELQIDCF